MEIKRKKKKKRLSDAILPIGLCLLVVFLTASLCLHMKLNRSEPARISRLSKPAEDANYQLLKNRPNQAIHRRQKQGDDAGGSWKNKHYNDNDNDNQNHNDDGSSESESDTDDENENDDSLFQDPGRLDPSITALERSRVKKLRLPRRLETVDKDIPYDVHRCPPRVPKNYPYSWSILDVLGKWNPDDTNIPDTIHQGLCAIDWSDPKQRKIAVHYRESEVPFVVKNHPVIWKAADRWSGYDYIYSKLGNKPYRNEHSHNNHMMYWKLRGKRKGPPGWEPPTEDVKLSFPDWYKKARALEDDPESSPTTEHFYLRLNAAWNNAAEWVFDELPFFNPTIQNDIFMVDTSDARGINCRLGSRGTIAEAHYDMSRNFILIMHGQKRYVLGHPDQCINMEMHPNGHPSARHSRINWSSPESWMEDGDNFKNAFVNEVVLEAGDGLYLPTYWLHFIVSLSLNYQCNARSGITYGYQQHIRDCGFA
mmetsp:Transcript_14614/g.40616  ORF Transcript_14614/g.40616 Transcript_14614/m.40616 type:complete len:480 (-) Transcript_14614:161-1600(-)